MNELEKRTKYVELDDSEIPRCAQATVVGAPEPDVAIPVTILLRAKPDPAHEHEMPSVEARAFHRREPAKDLDVPLAADETETRQLTEFLRRELAGFAELDLRDPSVCKADPASHRVELRLRPKQLEKLFGVELKVFETDGTRHLGYTGKLRLDADVAKFVDAVLGLNGVVFMPRLQASLSQDGVASMESTGYLPQQLASIYRFPTTLTGKGQRIALVLLQAGFYQSDMTTYFPSVGLDVPPIEVLGSNNPAPEADVQAVLTWFQTGGPPPFGGDRLNAAIWTVECTQDTQIAGAMANGAELIVKIAASNTTHGAYLALEELCLLPAAKRPSIVSCSWGSLESTFSAAERKAFERLFRKRYYPAGITVVFCAGNYGSSGSMQNAGLAVQYPGSSPWVTCCGGTTVIAAHTPPPEKVWNNTQMASGGGFSVDFPRPKWQTIESVESKHRGVPDIAADADPLTGMRIYAAGTSSIAGGTSAATPLWAALVARLNEGLGARLGHLAPTLYEDSVRGTMNDIVEGNNDLKGVGVYSARVGWDPCSGLGTPNGENLLAALAALLP